MTQNAHITKLRSPTHQRSRNPADDQFNTSAIVKTGDYIGLGDLDDEADEANYAYNSIVFTEKQCQFGTDFDVEKIYHYSDIKSRRLPIHFKTSLDNMPELPQLKHLQHPIYYNQVCRKNAINDISYSEEVVGSIKTLYSSSDQNERVEEFISN